jgi:hypothetical protein
MSGNCAKLVLGAPAEISTELTAAELAAVELETVTGGAPGAVCGRFCVVPGADAESFAECGVTAGVCEFSCELVRVERVGAEAVLGAAWGCAALLPANTCENDGAPDEFEPFGWLESPAAAGLKLLLAMLDDVAAFIMNRPVVIGIIASAAPIQAR